MCINSRLFVPRLAESLLHWFFFFFWLSSVWLWFSYLIHHFPSFVTGCAYVSQNVLEHQTYVTFFSVPRTCCSRCPLDAPQGHASSEFIRSREWCWKKWKVIFLNAPHRVQSHYRECQIQLVTEFAAQERGQVKQAGEGCGPGGYTDKVDGNKKTGFCVDENVFF